MRTEELARRIYIDHRVPKPPYLQLADAISARVLSGDVSPGTRLPSIAQLTDATGLSYNTIVRALGEVSRAGLIETKRGAGTFVLERTCHTTELLIHSEMPGPLSKRTVYFSNLIRGLEKGFNDVRRRVSLSYSGHHSPSVRETRAVMHARRADSLVVYNPIGPAEEVARSLARELPVLTLFCQCLDSQADSVISATDSTLRRLLRARLEQGRRHFICVFDHVENRRVSPYEQLRSAYYECMEEAGIEPVCLYADRNDAAAAAKALARLKALPDDAVVVAHTPRIPLRMDRRFEVISFTDFDGSVDEWTEEIAAGRLTMIYGDVTRCAGVGARLLMDRVEGRVTGPPKCVQLEPAVISNVADH